MGSINDRIVTDNITDVLAAQYNALLGSNAKADWSNGTTMTGTVTLTDADYMIQRFNCNGANRIVKLPAYSVNNHPFFIINATGAAYTLDVQSNAGVSMLMLLDTESVMVIPNGTSGFVLASAPNRVKVKHFLDAALLITDPNQTLVTGVFQTILLPTKSSDIENNYNSATGLYTVPESGFYQITTKLRMVDFSSPSLSVGQGCHTSNVDNQWFFWGVNNPIRNGIINVRNSYFNTGDLLRMYAFQSSGSSQTIVSAMMNIIFLGV